MKIMSSSENSELTNATHTFTPLSVLSSPSIVLRMLDISVVRSSSVSARSQPSPLPLELPLVRERLEPVSVAELERRVAGSADDSASSSASVKTMAHVKFIIFEVSLKIENGWSLKCSK